MYTFKEFVDEFNIDKSDVQVYAEHYLDRLKWEDSETFFTNIAFSNISIWFVVHGVLSILKSEDFGFTFKVNNHKQFKAALKMILL